MMFSFIWLFVHTTVWMCFLITLATAKWKLYYTSAWILCLKCVIALAANVFIGWAGTWSATGNYGIFLAKVNSTNERNICSLHAVTSCFPVSLYMQLCSFLAPLQWRCTVNFWSCLCNWQWPWGPNWVDGLLSMQDCMCWNLQWFDGVACKCKACFHHFLCATCSITSDSWDTITLHLISVSVHVLLASGTCVCK